MLVSNSPRRSLPQSRTVPARSWRRRHRGSVGVAMTKPQPASEPIDTEDLLRRADRSCTAPRPMGVPPSPELTPCLRPAQGVARSRRAEASPIGSGPVEGGSGARCAHKPWVAGGTQPTCGPAPNSRSTPSSATRSSNTTWYAEPSADTVERWLDQTPSDFRFVPSSLDRHPRPPLQDVAARAQLLDRIEPLGDRTGPVQVQLPPAFGPCWLRCSAPSPAAAARSGTGTAPCRLVRRWLEHQHLDEPSRSGASPVPCRHPAAYAVPWVAGLGRRAPEQAGCRSRSTMDPT